MPKRVIDFDAMWASDKIAACAEWAQTEYAWLYGLADCCGCFELTNLRVIWGRVAAVRKNLSLERLEQVFDEFHDKGLLFLWNENGKRYGHWTGSDVPGRLPPMSWRNRLERLAPAVPREQFAEYLAKDAGRAKNEMSRELEFAGAMESVARLPHRGAIARVCELKPHLEATQAQGLDLGLDQEGKGEVETHTPVLEAEKRVSEPSPLLFLEKIPGGKGVSEIAGEKAGNSPSENASTVALECASRRDRVAVCATPEVLAEIWGQERGSLPELRGLTAERVARCRERLANARKNAANASGGEEDVAARFLRDFRDAVKRAAATPFLCGAGPAGWRANFDWIIANDTNYLKVLEGRYDSGSGAAGNCVTGNSVAGNAGNSHGAQLSAKDEAARREIYVGAGPTLEPGGARVRAGVIDRAIHRG